MKPVVAVSGYCQVAGMFRALSVLLPDHDVRYVALPTGPSDTDVFRGELAKADVWACADTFPNIESYAPDCRGTIVKWPQVVFPGFHPDIVLAYHEGKAIEPLGTPYNSAIALWAYVCGVPETETISLYSKNIFSSLGYFDYFDIGIVQLKKQFEDCDIDFSRYFRSMKRREIPFMHSHDHSKICSIVEVARQVAARIHPEIGKIDDPIDEIIEDALLYNTIWPVYPDIAKRFAVTGSYRWKILNHYVPNLASYVNTVFDHYKSIGLSKSSLACSRFEDGLYDKVIADAAGHA